MSSSSPPPSAKPLPPHACPPRPRPTFTTSQPTQALPWPETPTARRVRPQRASQHHYHPPATSGRQTYYRSTPGRRGLPQHAWQPRATLPLTEINLPLVALPQQLDGPAICVTLRAASRRDRFFPVWLVVAAVPVSSSCKRHHCLRLTGSPQAPRARAQYRFGFLRRLFGPLCSCCRLLWSCRTGIAPIDRVVDGC